LSPLPNCIVEKVKKELDPTCVNRGGGHQSMDPFPRDMTYCAAMVHLGKPRRRYQKGGGTRPIQVDHAKRIKREKKGK